MNVEIDVYATKKELEITQDNFAPHNLSKKICDAIRHQKDIDQAIRDILKESLEKDVMVQNVIKKIIYENWKIFMVYILPILTTILNFIMFFNK